MHVDDPFLDTPGSTDESVNHGITYLRLEDLVVQLGSGNDVFSVKSTHDGTTSVFGNGGIDTIKVGAKKAPSGSNPEDLGVLNNVGGTLTVNGGAGDDVLNVYDDGDIHPAELAGQYLSVGHLAATTVSGFGMTGAGIVYADFGTLYLRLGVGADRLAVDSTHEGRTYIWTGDANTAVAFDPNATKTIFEAETGRSSPTAPASARSRSTRARARTTPSSTSGSSSARAARTASSRRTARSTAPVGRGCRCSP